MTVIFSSETVPPQSTARPAAMLPLLVILFVVSYCILTMLVFEQGQTIESQRTLIREMLKDSNQLATLKGKIARDDSKRIHDKASAADHTNASDAASGKGKRPGKSARTTQQIPGRPAADLEDVRRATRVI